MRRKITVVGAGNVGATAAQEIARRDYADVVLVDIVEGLPQGKALDMNEAGPVLGYEAKVVGTNGYEETAGSDVVVVTSGKPRSPGMSRDDLVTTNQAIVGAVTEELRSTPRPTRSSSWSPTRSTRCVTSRSPCRASRRSASSAWRASSTRPASGRSSPGRRACPTATSRRWCSAATATRWFRSSRRRRWAASR